MFSKRVTAAFDLGGHSLKYVAVEPDTGTVRAAWERELMPERAGVDESLEGDVLGQRLRTLLKAFRDEQPSAPAGVVSALQGMGTWVHYLELPEMASTELKVAAEITACKLTPYSLDQLVVTHVTVPPLRDAGRMGVLVLAALKEPAQRLSGLFEEGGFTIQRLELVPTALAREFGRNHPERADTCVAVVNAGFSVTHVVIVKGGLPYSVREIGVGGRQFTYGLQTGEHLPWSVAETLKREYDVTGRVACYEPFVQAWLRDVARSLQHFERQVAARPGIVREVFLSGGAGTWKGLDVRLQEHLGLPVTVDGWEQLRFVPTPTRDNSVAFKAAVGMALAQ